MCPDRLNEEQARRVRALLTRLMSLEDELGFLTYPEYETMADMLAELGAYSARYSAPSEKIGLEFYPTLEKAENDAALRVDSM